MGANLPTRPLLAFIYEINTKTSYTNANTYSKYGVIQQANLGSYTPVSNSTSQNHPSPHPGNWPSPACVARCLFSSKAFISLCNSFANPARNLFALACLTSSQIQPSPSRAFAPVMTQLAHTKNSCATTA